MLLILQQLLHRKPGTGHARLVGHVTIGAPQEPHHPSIVTLAASCLCLFTLASDSVIWSLCFEWSTRLLVSQYNIHMHVAFLIGDDESKANTTLKSTWNDSFSSLFVDPENHFISAPSMNTRSCPVWKCLPEDLRWWEVFESEDMQRISGWNHLFEWGYSMTTYTSYIIETIIFL